MNSIPWKFYPIEIEVGYGKPIQAVINYWEKDYFIEVRSPFSMKIPGEHMLHMIRAKYVLVESAEDISGYHQVPILEKCKNKIIRHFDTGAI